MQTPRNPLDRRKYAKSPFSQIAVPGISDGEYVYVQDLDSVVWVLRDGPHTHPKVLGAARPALYAGTLLIRRNELLELTNLSGTFRCDDEDGLLEVARYLESAGWILSENCVRFFPFDGTRPVILK